MIIVVYATTIVYIKCNIIFMLDIRKKINWCTATCAFAKVSVLLTLYDPGGALKAPPPPIFRSHAFNVGAVLLCVGDFSQIIV